MVQRMMNALGEPKGLVSVLTERGFDISKIKKTKCSPVCPFENEGCCLAWLLSQQDDFNPKNQKSLLEKVVTDADHLCLFLPKFHCELNPIEMVSLIDYCDNEFTSFSQYWGWCKYRYREVSKEDLHVPRKLPSDISTLAQWR
jgi:hypothetical protein